MIKLFGGINVMIKEINIEKLHGEYDYNIKFDEKLTFLYGNNGCGKTTILNILASIITGKLYNLSSYKFKSIILNYTNGELNVNHYIKLSIIKNYDIDKNNTDDTAELKVDYINVNNEHKIKTIDKFFNIKEILYRKTEGGSNMDDCFLSMYPFILEIKKIFNYVYLPLNRYGKSVLDDRDYYRYSPRFRYYMENPYNTYLNDSLRYVESIIKDSCMHINIEENECNNKFRNDILSSSITLTNSMPIVQIFNDMDDWKEILNSKSTYIKILKEIGIYNDEFKIRIEEFYKEFKDDYDEHTKKTGMGARIDFIWKYAEYLKIKSITKLAEENEKNKEKIRKPRELFIKIINDFLSSGGTEKTMEISNSGDVMFVTKNNKLDITCLSSGEKQILITFASLIFRLNENKNGIFIVDEPEASLHLDWQSKYVKSILDINDNLQLIFATHSPELIGKYRLNAVELKRYLS